MHTKRHPDVKLLRLLPSCRACQGQYCDICSSANSNKAHPITNAIDGTERWWQSPPLSRGLEFNQVNVTLDLGQLFHVAYVLIKFANSPRPDLWVLERSTDFGLTYEPWQYFASSKRDCIEKFGLQTVDRITKDDHAICTTEYSRIVPLENGEIVVSLVNGRPGAMNFSYSPLLRNFTKATNIRLRFLQTNTLLGHLMGKALRDPTVTRRYYYSIKDISIGGRCVCHGHADVCDAKDPNDPYRLQCDCQHNTCGGSCDRCCPGFNQFPWKPATADSANECQPCNCNGHAYDCYYDPEVDRHKASKSHEDKFEGGGVCIDCQHHTTGINCERCIPGYYRSPDHLIDSPYVCYRCNCESDFTDGTCEDLTGRCYCKPNYTGEHCDACAEGYLNFPHCYPIPAFTHNDTGEQVLPAGQIINCDCYAGGTEGNACRKDPRVGMCVCKPNFQGTHCDQCAPGHYGPTCQPCQCSGPGQYDGTCDSETGQCLCRTGFEGHLCNQCAPGYFNYPLCQLCGCSAVGTLPEGCDAVGRCFCRLEFAGPRCEQCSPGHHSYPHCYACSCDARGAVDNNCSPAGQCRCHVNFAGHTCNQCALGFYGYPSCTPCQCSQEGSLHSTCDQDTGQCSCRPKVTGLRCDSCVLGAYGFPHCEVGSCNPAGLVTEDPSLVPGSCACRAYVEGPACDRCKPLYWNLTPENPYGCLSCKCDTKGTISRIAECRQGDGQCFCKPNICGQFCSACKDGYFNMENANYFGCQGCRCDVGGSLGPSCEERSGACRCRQSTRGPTCTQPAQDHYFPDLHHLKFELEEGTTPAGRAVRFGYNPLEFEGFSWRGYAQMSSIQPKVVVTLNVTSPDLFRLVFRYVSRGPASVEGRVSVVEEGKFNVCGNCKCVPVPGVPIPSVPISGGRPVPCHGMAREGEERQAGRQNKIRVTVDVKEAELYLFHVILRYINSGGATVYGKITAYQPRRRGIAVSSHPAMSCRRRRATKRWLNKPRDRDNKYSGNRHKQDCMGTDLRPFKCPSGCSSCVPSRFLKLSQSIVLEGGQVLAIAPDVPLAQAVHVAPAGVPVEPAPRPPTAVDPTAELILLQPPQAAVVFNSRIQALGRYAFILHYYQPNHPTFPVEVLINGGRIWQGQTNANFCPHGYGCRSLVVSEDQIILDVTDNDLTVVVRVPEGRWPLDYILVVPEDSYSSQYLQEEPLDKSYDFISSCGINSFYINPSTSSRFCRDSAISLSLFYNNGAQPCQCHEAGARGRQCEPFGGQCPCKSNVIGRECSRCATGYWGFPSCRPCDCGTRLCDEVTGQCICPPHTLKPECVVCEPQTFGCHPLIGCEDCNCSRPGVQELTEPGCDVDSGQCRFAIGCVHKGSNTQCLCKPGYAGPNCERCAPGYYGNPLVIGSSCQPCDCSGNTDPNMLFSSCDSLTGACTGCMHHTAGTRCELCAPGYYGDAVAAKNCTQCNCSPCGTDSCHPRTGQCFCKTGVTGQHCDHCEEGYYGFEGCSGCRRCDCDVGAVGSSCHVQTGQCTCLPGVSGPRCQQCAPGYWGFSQSGCTRCECRGGSCDPRTGECTCSNGLTGKQCDVCMHEHEVPVANGPDSVRCEVCDSCVLLLLEDLQSIEMSFPSIRNQLVNLNASSIAWARLHGLNGTMAAVANQLREYQRAMSKVRQRADELEDENVDLTQDLNALQHKMTMTHREANRIEQHTKETYQRGEQLLLNIQSIQKGIADLVRQMVRFGAANASTTSTEEFRQKMAEVERMLREMKERSLGSQEELARREHEEAQKLLHRVRSELHARWESNQDLVSSIRERLAQHSAQLMDLRDALNEAVNKTRQTEDLNSLNRNNLEESQQKSRELQKQHMLVQETLRMAKDSLAQVSDFLQKMERAKEAYEKLAALLDGAKLPLTERVKKFSPASSKIPIVEQAEEHARLLDELARNLSSIIQGTNQDGFIQRAIDASNAYASIIEAVKKAERAAHDADEAAGEALMNVISENLGAISKELKRNSSNLEESVRREQRKLNGAIKGTLQTAKDKLADLRVKKDQLLSQLQSVQDMLGRDQEDTKEMIQNAKAAAAEANETAARVEDTLSTMKKQLDEWKDQYGGLRNEDLNQAVQDARKSVSSLESTIPLLLGKLSSLENRRNKNATVSENIVRIRQLITQARNAASKVKVPMKFNGSSGVQVRMPSNLQDLAAYTSLKFYIQNPEPRSRQRRQDGTEEGRFVLYLGSREAVGDYLGIVLKDHKVQWVYKLGDEEPASLTVDEDIGEQFATISINRILQYGHMSVIVERQTVHETKGDSVAKGEQGLLNLDPHNVVFYVGGYPSSFTPPPTLRYPNYRGCLELDTLNEEVVSLYNFQHTFQLDTTAEKPCARSKSTGDPWLTDGSYFDGTGYAEIKFESQFGTTKRFEQEIRVVSYNGILFFLENQGQFLCLAIRDGKLVLYYDFSTGLEMAKPSSNSSSLTISSTTNKAIQIFLLKMNNKKRILVRLERLTIFMVEQENSLENAVSYYLGGVPPAVLPPSLKALFPTGGPIRGCMKGLKALGKYVDLKRMSTVGVSYGCTSDLLVARSVSIHGHGYLTLALKDVPGLRDFYSGFSFRTSQREGLLYHHATQEGTCRVSLQRGQLALNLLETEITTENTYADDRTHYAAFYSDARGVRLYVDDELQDTVVGARPGRRQRRQDGWPLFQLGGSPEPGALSNLTGCIGNVFVKRTAEPQMVVDLQQNAESINVTMSCPWGEQPQQLRITPKKDRRKPKVPGKPAWKDRRHDQDGLCRLHPQPRAAVGTFRFGGAPSSRLEFEEIPVSFGQRSYFSLEVKLNSSSGLLFYVGGERGTFLALFVSNGRFVFLLDVGGRQLRIRSKDKYRDRQWHTVFFSRDQSRAQLVIDGLRAQGAAVATAGLFVAQTPLYVGGVPAGKAKAHVPAASASSFDGCLRNPQLDGRPLGRPSHTFGVTPCYEGALESGVFFAADGGSIVLADAVVTEQDLEVTLEVRPRSASGLIFHIGTRRSRHLLLYMEESKVTVRAGTGAGEFSASVTCPSLCDGQWHTIAVTKWKNIVQVDVDTQGNYTAGPSLPPAPSTRATFYVGGLPETDNDSTVSPLPPLPHYVGCIRNLVINRSHVDLPRAGTVRGSVGLRGCPML
ncbi:laminin subunit alpha-5 [Athene cunicularia]|uniref:laminin subunit alpha-5 n=1 Tax=Athene cunicularia TaxID=194338 RepID=UPI000EF6C2F1|nr:laminin subunit alpha-5 [Athene cunicularia]